MLALAKYYMNAQALMGFCWNPGIYSAVTNNVGGSANSHVLVRLIFAQLSYKYMDRFTSLNK